MAKLLEIRKTSFRQVLHLKWMRALEKVVESLKFFFFFVSGVTRQVGDALLLERSQRNNKIVTIGIAPWGIVENNHELVGRNKDVPYHSISSPR